MKTKSLLRKEEYKALSNLTIEGKILDVGGSKNSGYLELIKGDHDIVVGNINESYGIDIIFDAEERWPFTDEEFSGVLLMNILEHLYSYRMAVDESYRVLRKGGVVAGVVPFMFNVHGSPSDYFRYTRFSLERIFKDAGFQEVKVSSLGTGAFSVIYHNLIGFVRWYWLADILMSLAMKLDNFVALIKPNNKMSAEFMPLGYYFEARK